MVSEKLPIMAKSALLGAGVGAVVMVFRDERTVLEEDDPRNIVIAIVGMAGTAAILYYGCQKYGWSFCEEVGF